MTAIASETASAAAPTETPGIADLIRDNLPFVVSVAHEYRHFGVPFEDLLNEGNLGLIEAARRFDGQRGVKFTTYAIWWIRKYILKALSDQSTLVRIPDHRKRAIQEIHDQGAALERRLGRRAGRDELSEELGRDRAALDRSLAFQHVEISLEERLGREGSRSLGDSLADPTGDNPEDALLRRELQDRVAQAIQTLSRRTWRVLRDRFGLQGERPLTLREIGSREGISRERARQLEREALERLERLLRKQVQAPPRPAAGQPDPDC
jgi:RNA polymerase primary sigma factor